MSKYNGEYPLDTIYVVCPVCRAFMCPRVLTQVSASFSSPQITIEHVFDCDCGATFTKIEKFGEEEQEK